MKLWSAKMRFCTPKAIYEGVFMNLRHATDDENAFRRSAVCRRRSIFLGVVTNLEHATSDEKPSPRRWRDSPLPSRERGWGRGPIFLGDRSHGPNELF